MNESQVIEALSALSNEVRLRILKHLVSAGSFRSCCCVVYVAVAAAAAAAVVVSRGAVVVFVLFVAVAK